MKNGVIIIGGGFAGLGAAALLAKRGRQVLVLEKERRPGGRAGYFERDGFVWQHGQHSHRLEKHGIAAELFETMGAPIDFVDMRDATAYLYWNGHLYPRPDGPLQFLSTSMMPLSARVGLLRFYRRVLKTEPGPWYDKSLLDFYLTVTPARRRNATIERFLSFIGFTIMMPDPALASAGEVIDFIQRAHKAPVKQGEPRGGSRQLIDKLVRVCNENGASIHLGEPVERICVENGRAMGVRTAESHYEAEHVVYAAPLNGLLKIVDPGLFAPEFVSYVTNIEPSRGLSIDFVFDEPPTDIKGGIIGVDVPMWVKFESNFDDSVAPPGKHLHTWAMLFDRHAPLDNETVRATEKRLKDAADNAIPGYLDKVVGERRIVMPVVNANMLKPEQSYPHRPPIHCPDVTNLHFIGDTTRGRGCSGDISFSSAMMLADSLQ